MGRKSTTEEFIKKAKQRHNDKYDYSQTVYTGDKIKVIIICPKHGPFEQRPSSHLSGCGCPVCARMWSDEHRKNHAESSKKSNGMTTEEWIERARSVHGNKYDYSRVVYANQKSMVKIVCPVHGLFEQQADSHLRGTGCRKCWYEFGDHVKGHQWTEEQRQKIATTCLERYGAMRYLDSTEGRQKNAVIRGDVEFRKKMHDIISSDAVQDKTKNTCKSRYGVDSAMKLESTIIKVGESKRLNGTWSTSKPEERMYELLCMYFGVDDVVRQYRDLRYPFHCDFYVKSLDLFIELNATWLHGGHWFDGNDYDDLQLLKEWQHKVSDNHKFYEVAIDVWTIRDVKKRKTAIENNLNYVAFWKNDLSDFISWLEADELILNNIL